MRRPTERKNKNVDWANKSERTKEWIGKRMDRKELTRTQLIKLYK